MRGPVAPELAAVYRDTVDLMMMETYYDLNNAWMIPFQLQTARLNGMLGKTILGLGIGHGNPNSAASPGPQTAGRAGPAARLIRLVGARVAGRGVLRPGQSRQVPVDPGSRWTGSAAVPADPDGRHRPEA